MEDPAVGNPLDPRISLRPIALSPLSETHMCFRGDPLLWNHRSVAPEDMPGVGVLGMGVPRLACLRPATWLKRGPSAAHLHQLKLKDPHEGPSVAGRTTGSFLRGILIRQAREEAERSRQGYLARNP